MNAYSGPHFLKTPDAALRLGLSARTLEKHRCYGTGPMYRKLGGRIVYAIEDLDAWAEVGRRRSTSDPGNGTVHPARPVRR
ncbi:helix-turn-helix domain protein (plasmid) [Blastomonas sp. RAC04]|uniref:helix-turn-helix transcriptional regulator n=1 Tax=Blastomonas sp. RAC04 TaxID=1842535 RepID=UPI00083DA5A8|nr:helix-turn-helix domain-containing protein [Blastomonas sp. RAC04]AOF98757.1 helix-turn-helix domain protein [Blastomonas sp. RAC04]